MKLSIHGAAQTVTGSCHLLQCNGLRIVVDCGFFQGAHELEDENRSDFGFDPASIDYVLLTHAHLDHVGRLPLLARRGFQGEVIATAATFELARLVLLDSVHLQTEAARHHRHGRPHGNQPRSAEEPLYSMLDALDVIGRFGRAVQYGKPVQLGPTVRATFFDAGHILGSSSILVEVSEAGEEKSILFSGDIGNAGSPLLRAPQTPSAADFIVMESTYGDRDHRPFDDSVGELFDAIDTTIKRGGNVLIPTFALERTQDLLYSLHRGVALGRLPPSLPVFLDSPMAISATEIFRKHPESCSPDLGALLTAGEDPFLVAGLRLTRETTESMAINRIKGGAVIMAGAGMCTGGRIRHHLMGNLGNAAASVVFVGFAAVGTLARQIVDGAKMVRIFGEQIPVRAQVHTINGFSAHAGQRELVAWHAGISRVRTTFLVHGEPGALSGLRKAFRGGDVKVPNLHQAFEL